ncbi:MAG: WbqC family protein [Bacteroidales bacterium]|jgi:hypothetical protein|nr:WbqC family protein [Bacteroidales bacterium]
MKRVAIIQSDYIPWKGYFDIIRSVDEFILLDCVQYTRRDWRNRNRICTERGLSWLTIPVETKGRYYQKINEVKVADRGWSKRHWKRIEAAYSRAPFFEQYGGRFREAYDNAAGMQMLSRVNLHFITLVNDILDTKTPVVPSPPRYDGEDRNRRLISICRHAGADEYLTGPSAMDYLDAEQFAAEGISILWADYSGYPEYSQLHTPFRHDVSIIDLIFNTGPSAPSYMKKLAWT